MEFSGNQLFCSTCLRNQHLYTSSLATFYPEDDDTLNTEDDPNYEKYRRDLELRYPQVCETCEPRVKQQMRQAGYEAKADNLRRIMDRTREFKANQRARERGWQSSLVYLGSLCYWLSIGGQLVWDFTCAVTLAPFVVALNPSSPALSALMRLTVQVTELQSSLIDPSSVARTALIMGCLSIWWNPKLRMKVVGSHGRLANLAEYYEIQLIFMLIRVIFWSLFKDPSASGIDALKCMAGHLFMMLFTNLVSSIHLYWRDWAKANNLKCVYISRLTIKYEPVFKVDWSDKSWEKIPLCSPRTSPQPEDLTFGLQLSPKVKRTPNTETRGRIPLEKLSSASTSAAKSPVLATPPPDSCDDMDWTPVKTQVIQPTVSLHQRNRPAAFTGPSPFHGNIPPVSKPLSWDLRTRTAAPSAAFAPGNPFHRSPTQNQPPQQLSTSPEPVFQPPRFFPQSDYQTDTGLEVMFDRAFSFGPGDNKTHQSREEKPRPRPRKPLDQRRVRARAQFALLLITVGAWVLAWNRLLPVSGNYVETFTLGIASIVSGLSLLEALKKPFQDLPGYEIAVNTLQLVWSVYHMLMNPIERAYFEPLAIPATLLLLIFMTGQSGLRLLIISQPLPKSNPPNSETSNAENERQLTQSPSFQSGQFEQYQIEPAQSPSTESAVSTSFTRPNSIEPPLSFGTTAASTSFSSALPSSSPNYQLASSRSFQPFNTNFGYQSYNPTVQDHNGTEYSDYEEDSDTETVASSATNLTTGTNRNIRYGLPPRGPSDEYSFSPRRKESNPLGLGGLSLGNDQPIPRRMTRSQTQRNIRLEGIEEEMLSSRTRR